MHLLRLGELDQAKVEQLETIIEAVVNEEERAYSEHRKNKRKSR